MLPARTGFARYDFIAGEDAASEFIRAILPALTASGFNNYGVFRALSGAITAYNEHRPSSGPPMLLMQLSK
ncbi:hypothetical protein [Leptolyngbya sp. 7M]|uniref:hypothetical protein n=1 Tax=Leptolyngbya sp. 7M TaxID=2812896 RepID=UPI001B8BB539|nr:hypothetical protein [Leptolyngbya sp. 7M]QYO65002.1 hypothetical protein JVX88_36685 [Leptolyngbya sp. 7M]